jgi:hypothetical protein
MAGSNMFYHDAASGSVYYAPGADQLKAYHAVGDVSGGMPQPLAGGGMKLMGMGGCFASV